MAQAMGMCPPTPNQQQQSHMAAAAGRMPGSPSHAGSPRGSSFQRMDSSPATPGTPHSTHVPSPSQAEGGTGRGSPYNQIRASPLRSPGAKSPHHYPGPKAEPHSSGNDASQTSLVPLNGQQQEHLQPKVSAVGHAPQPGSREGALCRVTLQNIKQEPREMQCDSDSPADTHPGAIKREAALELVNCGNSSGFINAENMGGDPATQGRSETGQQLLQKLLRTKNLQLAAQRPSEGIHNEINGHINSKLAMLEQKLQGTPRNMEVSSTRQPLGWSFSTRFLWVGRIL